MVDLLKGYLINGCDVQKGFIHFWNRWGDKTGKVPQL